MTVKHADYNTVRNDPSYPEKLDAEIIPLCDALNDAEFPTASSCSGHGRDWPRVWFEDMPDDRIESLARSIMASEINECRQHFSVFRRKVLANGYERGMEIHLTDVFCDTDTDVFCDTDPDKFMQRVEGALSWATAHVRLWYSSEVLFP